MHYTLFLIHVSLRVLTWQIEFREVVHIQIYIYVKHNLSFRLSNEAETDEHGKLVVKINSVEDSYLTFSMLNVYIQNMSSMK